MILNSIERNFLIRLSTEAWTSPPVFDHRLLDRVVEAGYAERHSAMPNAIHYEITDDGRAAVVVLEN